jgi:hypothetical protein
VTGSIGIGIVEKNIIAGFGLHGGDKIVGQNRGIAVVHIVVELAASVVFAG